MRDGTDIRGLALTCTASMAPLGAVSSVSLSQYLKSTKKMKS
jgi:hypothetical protein